MKKFIKLTDNFPFLAEVGIMKFLCETMLDYRTRLMEHHHGRFYEIGYIQNGIFVAMIFPNDTSSVEEAQFFELHGGDLILFSPYTLHSTAPDYPFNALTYWIELDPECPRFLNLSVEAAALLRETLHNIHLSSIHIPQSIGKRLLDAFRLLMNPNEANVLHACNLLSLFILETAEFGEKFSSQYEKYKSMSPAVMEAILFINNNLMNPDLNLDSIARHLQYSRTYTSTFLKQELGMTLQEYIRHNKIKCACELLRNHSVTEVAMLLNFSSSQYFSNVFKKQMKMTPSEFRNNLH